MHGGAGVPHAAGTIEKEETMFGTGQNDPFEQARQLEADRQAAWNGMKNDLPALGLIAGLSMLANNHSGRSAGELIGLAGGDALDAYGTWQKLQEAKRMQERRDAAEREEKEAAARQRQWENSMAEKKLGLEAAKTAFDMDLRRRKAGLPAAQRKTEDSLALQGNQGGSMAERANRGGSLAAKDRDPARTAAAGGSGTSGGSAVTIPGAGNAAPEIPPASPDGLDKMSAADFLRMVRRLAAQDGQFSAP